MREMEYPIYITASLAISASCLFIYKYFLEDRRLNLPPGPFPLPIVGNLLTLGADSREPLLKMKERFGDVFTLYFGSRRVIFLSSYDAIKEAFVKQAQSFSGRPQDLLIFRDVAKNRGIVSTQGSQWKEMRKFAHGVLREFGMGRQMIEEKIVEELSYFLHHLQEEANGGAFDPHHHLQMSMSNVICSVAFGKRYEYTDADFVKYLEMLDMNFKLTGSSGPLTVIPQLKYLPGDMFGYRRLLANTQAINSNFQAQIDSHRSRGIPDSPEDFIDAFLIQAEKEKSNPNTNFTDFMALGTIVDLFVAGTETTATTLNWGLLYMVLNPAIQERVQKEILEVIGPHRMPSMKDKQSMPYTEACMMEIQRMADLVPLALPHSVTEDVALRGYNIPKGTMVMANLTSVHRDPNIWPKPYNFDPSRFIDEDNKIKNKEHLIPFSMGKRICLGESLARMELFLFFTSMMQRFSFSLPQDQPQPSTQGVTGLTIAPPPFKIIAKVNNYENM